MSEHIGSYTIIPLDKLQGLEESKSQALACKKRLAEITDIDPTTLAGLANYAHEQHKKFDAVRAELKKPALEATRDIDSRFRETLATWAEVKAKAKALILEEQKRIEAANTAAIMATAASASAPTLALVPEAPPEGITIIDAPIPYIKVIDFSAVPEEYKCLDWSAVKLAWKSGVRSIPGIEFQVDRQVRVGGK